MLMETHRKDACLVVKPLERRIDIYTANQFRDQVIELLQEKPGRLLVDLAKVDFIDSSGLGCLISLFKNLGGHNSLSLCNVRTSVMSLFKLTRMDRVFEIYETDVEALKHDWPKSSQFESHRITH